MDRWGTIGEAVANASRINKTLIPGLSKPAIIIENTH